jgi:hypothetical protein
MVSLLGGFVPACEIPMGFVYSHAVWKALLGLKADINTLVELRLLRRSRGGFELFVVEVKIKGLGALDAGFEFGFGEDFHVANSGAGVEAGAPSAPKIGL